MNNLRKTLTSVFCLYLLACTPAPDSPVVVASNDWIGYRPLYLAQQLNYFDEHTVRLLELTSASEVLRKFRNGVIQVAALTLDEALLLKQDGFDITIILVMDISAGADAIVAHGSDRAGHVCAVVMIIITACRAGWVEDAIGADDPASHVQVRVL